MNVICSNKVDSLDIIADDRRGVGSKCPIGE